MKNVIEQRNKSIVKYRNMIKNDTDDLQVSIESVMKKYI